MEQSLFSTISFLFIVFVASAQAGSKSVFADLTAAPFASGEESAQDPRQPRPPTTPATKSPEPKTQQTDNIDPRIPQVAPKEPTKELVDRKNKIPPVPVPPAPPPVVPVDPAKYVNQEARFSGTSQAVLNKDSLVAVIARRSLVGEDSSAGKYVSDILYAALQKQGISLVDRDYRPVKDDEVNKIEKLGDQLTYLYLTPDEQRLLRREERPATHIIIVHSVPIPNNPAMITLPFEVPDEEWNKYKDEKSKYLAAVKSYNSAVIAYNAEFQRVLRQMGKGMGLMPPGKESPQNADENAEENAKKLAGFVRLYENMEEGAVQSIPYGHAPQLIPIMPNKLEHLTPPMAWASSSQEYWRYLRLYNRPEEVVGDQTRPAQTVTAFQGAVSIRVIELSSSKAIWFGMAHAQNLSFAEVMDNACGKIVSRLVAPEKSGK